MRATIRSARRWVGMMKPVQFRSAFKITNIIFRPAGRRTKLYIRKRCPTEEMAGTLAMTRRTHPQQMEAPMQRGAAAVAGQAASSSSADLASSLSLLQQRHANAPPPPMVVPQYLQDAARTVVAHMPQLPQAQQAVGIQHFASSSVYQPILPLLLSGAMSSNAPQPFAQQALSFTGLANSVAQPSNTSQTLEQQLLNHLSASQSNSQFLAQASLLGQALHAMNFPGLAISRIQAPLAANSSTNIHPHMISQLNQLLQLQPTLPPAQPNLAAMMQAQLLQQQQQQQASNSWNPSFSIAPQGNDQYPYNVLLDQLNAVLSSQQGGLTSNLNPPGAAALPAPAPGASAQNMAASAQAAALTGASNDGIAVPAAAAAAAASGASKEGVAAPAAAAAAARASAAGPPLEDQAQARTGQSASSSRRHIQLPDNLNNVRFQERYEREG